MVVQYLMQLISLNYTLKMSSVMLHIYVIFTIIKSHIRNAKIRRVNGSAYFLTARQSNKQLYSKYQSASSLGEGVKETSPTYSVALDIKKLFQVRSSDLDSSPWGKNSSIKILILLNSHGQMFGDNLLSCIYLSYSTGGCVGYCGWQQNTFHTAEGSEQVLKLEHVFLSKKLHRSLR